MNLSKLEIDKLQHLLNDDLLLKTIEKIFNMSLDRNLPEIKWMETNNLIGQRYRAYEQAKGIIRAAFIDLISYKNEVVKDEKIANKGR